MHSPEELAREKIDKLLRECGWIMQNRITISLSAGRGIAIRQFDRGNLGDQTQKESQQFVTPDGRRKSTEL
jgi:hypothetical protein